MPYNHKLALLLFASFALLGTPALTNADNNTHQNKASNDSKSHAPDHHKHWSYGGEDGPEHWGSLEASYAQCATGAQQSPVDLISARSAPLAPIQINWAPFVPSVVNNGHTIQVNVEHQSQMVLDGKTFTLLQFHFHHNSEHTVDGKHYPLEVHFVHKADDGTLGVLGVFFKEGEANPALQSIWDIAPLEKDTIVASHDFDATDLLPAERGYYRYQGSLTTPPCSEIVDWAVFSHPIEASKAQINAFAQLYANNYRPAQPINRRYILRSE